MTCTTCSNELDSSDVFCGSCGNKVMAPTSPSGPAVVPGTSPHANPQVTTAADMQPAVESPQQQSPQTQPPIEPQA